MFRIVHNDFFRSSCCCGYILKLACGPETRETENIFSDIFIMFFFLPYLNRDDLFALR